MKNLIQRICLVALLSLTGFQLSWAQQGLGVSSMGSFPIVPADSAYEGQQYTPTGMQSVREIIADFATVRHQAPSDP